VALILDTGPLLAALDAADPDHARCAALLTDSIEDLVVPALVLAELDYWCARRLSPDAWLIFLDDVLAKTWSYRRWCWRSSTTGAPDGSRRTPG